MDEIDREKTITEVAAIAGLYGGALMGTPARMIKTNEEFIEWILINHTELTVGRHSICNLNGTMLVFDGISAVFESKHPSLQEAVNAAVNLHVADILKTKRLTKGEG